MRRLSLLGLVMLAAMALGASSVQAAHLNPRNPFGSFNSGVNYGAQRWERSHHHGVHHVRRAS